MMGPQYQRPTAKRDSPPARRYVIAQVPQPRAMRRHALNRITHRPERPQRSRIDTERHRLGAAQPAADVCPVIDRARSQRLGTARGKGAPDCPLYRPATLGRRARPFAQIRVVCPFHWRLGAPINWDAGLLQQLSDCTAETLRLEDVGP